MPNGSVLHGLAGSGADSDPHMIMPAPWRSWAWVTLSPSPGTTRSGSKPNARPSHSMAAGASRYFTQGKTLGWILGMTGSSRCDGIATVAAGRATGLARM